MQAGAVDFLLKPTDAESLFDAIDRALEQDTRRKKAQR
jgi:FixJ family two-component response regulator